jgi:hypothetical protein
MIDDFGRFWNIYPRKASVVSTRQAWAIAITKASAQVIIDAATRYAGDPNRDPTYTPAPTRWLSEERWMDDPLPPRKLSPEEVIERDKKAQDERAKAEADRQAKLDSEASEARQKAVPMPPEIKQQLLALWSKDAYPKP